MTRQPSTPAAPTTSLTQFGLEHAQRLKFVREAGFTGDGRHGFYTVTETETVGESITAARDTHSLWLFGLDSSGARRAAGGLGNVAAPAPAPDGRSIALLADTRGKRQICLVPVDGGPVRWLTRLPQGVTGRPAWSPDGRSIAFTAGPSRRRDSSLPYRVDREPYLADGLGYLDDVVTDIYVVDVDSGATRRLTADRAMNSEPRWSPDGRALCYLVSFPPDRQWDRLPRPHVLTVADGRARAVVDAWGGAVSAEWCADGKRIVFVGSAAGRRFFATRKIDLWTVDVSGGTPECRTANVHAGVGVSHIIDLPSCRELVAPRIRVRGDVAYVGGQIGGDAVVYRIGLTGPEAVEPVVAEPSRSFYLADVDASGTVLSHVASFVEPPELALGTKRVTALNDALICSIERPSIRRLDVTAPDGVRSEAWALTPAGDGPWPTVLCVHGGPCRSYGSTYQIDFDLLVGAGFAVVFHNFRGSCGYGTEFSEKIVGDWGPGGAIDHHAALDEAVSAGIADPGRLGVYGLSYGGFSACWLVGTSDRFKAAVAENPLTNLTDHASESDIPWLVPTEYGGRPDEIPDTYRTGSPVTYAPNCTTPVLFIVGEQDLACTPIHSEQYYRILRSNGVPTQLLRLPNSAHIGSYDGPLPARIAQNEALVEWFTRYLAPASVRSADDTTAAPAREAMT